MSEELPLIIEQSRHGRLYLVGANNNTVCFETHCSRTAPPNSAYRYIHHCSRKQWLEQDPFDHRPR